MYLYMALSIYECIEDLKFMYVYPYPKSKPLVCNCMYVLSKAWKWRR